MNQEVPVAYKLLMTWDIQSGREQEYFEFVVREFVPRMQKLGLQPMDAWYTYYGSKPQIMTAAVNDSYDRIRGVLGSADWDALTLQLLDYVENFNYKVVKSKGAFQL